MYILVLLDFSPTLWHTHSRSSFSESWSTT